MALIIGQPRSADYLIHQRNKPSVHGHQSNYQLFQFVDAIVTVVFSMQLWIVFHLVEWLLTAFKFC